MFTREDFIEYFEQISMLERDMVYRMFRLRALAKDKNLTEALSPIFEDEIRHYTYARLVLDSILVGDIYEGRKHRRQHSFGEILIKANDLEKPVYAKCVDLSRGGVGIESAQSLKIGQAVEVWIDLYREGKTVYSKGKVMWMREIKFTILGGSKEHFYLGGIKFDES